MNWPTTRLRYVADLNPGIRADLLQAPDVEVSFLPMDAIGEDGTLDLSRNRAVAEVRNGYSYFEEGDVAFAKVTPCFENGKGALMRGLELGAGFGTTEITVLRPKVGTEPRFLNYVLRSEQFRQNGVGAMTGAGGLKRVPDEFTRDFKTPWPTPAEQERIANFLDVQTARIDALIAEKEQLLGRLTEFVASQLERSFTGADAPGGRQKTGSIFFPELPLHWQASALKHLLSTPVTDGPHETPDFVPEGVPFVSAEAVKGGRVDFDRKRGYISAELHSLYCQKVKPQRDDVFMVKSGNTTGAVAIVETDDEFSVWSPLAVLRADPSRVLARFLYLAMQTPYFQRSVQLFWSQGTQPNIGMAVLENLQIAVPALREQAEIVEKVGALRQRVDELVEHCRGHVDRLREYRSSLISAAVTLQLDLSTFKAAE